MRNADLTAVVKMLGGRPGFALVLDVRTAEGPLRRVKIVRM